MELLSDNQAHPSTTPLDPLLFPPRLAPRVSSLTLCVAASPEDGTRWNGGELEDWRPGGSQQHPSSLGLLPPLSFIRVVFPWLDARV